MRVLLFCAITALVLMPAKGLVSQEIVATPTPVATAADLQGAPSADNPPYVAGTDHWRYRWFDGRWWYWTLQNRWLWYGADRHWVEYQADANSIAQPFGNVNVGVGRLVNVDVYGQHGEVRVGGIFVGW